MAEHKNKSRAPVHPLDLGTLALSVGGLGFLRPAPGTWGSMPPPAIAAIMLLASVGAPARLVVALVCLVLGSVACVAWGRYAESRFGRKDAAEVVADETAGVAIPVALAGWVDGTVGAGIVSLAAAFVLFRIMDILKPWPARQLEALPYGWGVLVDDLVAGVYAAVVLGAAMWLLR